MSALMRDSRYLLAVVLSLALIAASGCGSTESSSSTSSEDFGDGVDVSAAVDTARSTCGSVSWQELERQFGGDTREGAASAFVSESFVPSVQSETYDACLDALK